MDELLVVLDIGDTRFKDDTHPHRRRQRHGRVRPVTLDQYMLPAHHVSFGECGQVEIVFTR